MEYLEFIQNKAKVDFQYDAIGDVVIHPKLFDFQKDCCNHLLKIGRGAAFLNTGLGKTIIQCEWARHMNGKVLFVAPLAVASQTVKEAKDKLGMEIRYSKDGTADTQFTITNYERVENFDEQEFVAIVLDESSILKGQSSKTRMMLTEKFKSTPFKLCATATPAPNDYMELGNHAEFLGIMTQQEMLSKWFVHDSANTADWRLKKHAVKSFWEWVASWAACVSKPSDLGYSDDLFELPPLKIVTHKVEVDLSVDIEEGFLFEMPDINASSLHRKKKQTVKERVELLADMVNSSKEPWIVWCHSNEESEMLGKSIPDCVEVKGSDSSDKKEQSLIDFSEQRKRVIVSKASICGFGMNWQHCRNQAFVSISYSFEQFFQAIRRSWRFGQTEQVNVHVIIADAEIPVWRSIERKARDHENMMGEMKHAVFKNALKSNNKGHYIPKHKGSLPAWI
jgi:hypothetical protein